MQAAQILAGYSLGEADLLRRAMGKKIRKEMQAQRERFVAGAVERGIEREQADAIFDLLERFAEYGFNKSHAAAYALVAYQTAYMKANYPVEFLAASMTLDMGNTDKLAEFRAEAERLGIKVEPPSINRSGVDFEVDGNTIIYALAALKGVGTQAVEAIVAARGERPFADLADFAAPHQSARRQQARAGKPGRRRRLRRVRAKPRARLRRRRCRARPRAARARRRRGRAERIVRRRRRSASRSRCRRSSPGCRPSGCSANTRRSASSSPAIRSTTTPPRSSECACSPGPSSRAR